MAPLGWYRAWGACEHCDYVGNMLFNDDIADQDEREGLCPVCSCVTKLRDMPDHPSTLIGGE